MYPNNALSGTPMFSSCPLASPFVYRNLSTVSRRVLTAVPTIASVPNDPLIASLLAGNGVGVFWPNTVKKLDGVSHCYHFTQT